MANMVERPARVPGRRRAAVFRISGMTHHPIGRRLDGGSFIGGDVHAGMESKIPPNGFPCSVSEVIRPETGHPRAWSDKHLLLAQLILDYIALSRLLSSPGGGRGSLWRAGRRIRVDML